MATPKARVKVPETAAVGEVITIKALISHRMESGQRQDDDGNLIPRRIIHHFTCAFEGTTVFECRLDSAMAANPYFEFSAKASTSGTFSFVWQDDNGETYREERAIKVS